MDLLKLYKNMSSLATKSYLIQLFNSSIQRTLVFQKQKKSIYIDTLHKSTNLTFVMMAFKGLLSAGGRKVEFLIDINMSFFFIRPHTKCINSTDQSTKQKQMFMLSGNAFSQGRYTDTCFHVLPAETKNCNLCLPALTCTTC